MQIKIKPRAVVIGLGAYFKKVRHGLSQYFDVVQLVDIRPFEALDLLPSERAYYYQTSSDLSTFIIDSNASCVMLFTPPAFHVPQIEQLAKFQIPILVEKPVATSSVEIPRLIRAIKENPRLYCSDFYADVRAVPLFHWIHPNHSTPLDSEIHFVSGDKILWDFGLGGLGTIERIEAYLCEGLGPAGSFDGREWLWEPSQGGILLDLMYHYFALSAYLFNFEGDFIPEKIVLGSTNDQREIVPWYPEKGLAETYALVIGQFASGIPFSFEAAKYWPTGTKRYFSLHCVSGTVSMHFGTPNILIIKSDDLQCEIRLEGNYYDHVIRRFCEYVIKDDQIKPYGLPQALSAIRAIDKVKSYANGT